jgi:hypothetical protein
MQLTWTTIYQKISVSKWPIGLRQEHQSKTEKTANVISRFQISFLVFSMIGLPISDQGLPMNTVANRSSVRLKDGLIEPHFGEIAIE